MPIKYAEITIVRNLEEENWFNYFKRLAGNENIVNDNDTIIILFENGSISDVKSEYVDKQFEMGPKGFQKDYPIYLNKKDGPTLFFKRPIVNADGNLTLDFKSIFKDNPKYRTITKVSSIYNAIYQGCSDHDIFAIVKNGPNERSPRYLLAYEDSYFERSDIIYFVSCIFKNTFTYNKN
jgi:hypothetical protein